MNEPVSHREHVRYSFHCEDVSDELRIRHFYGHEELSRPYEFFVLLQAADLSGDLHAFLGKHVAVQASRFDEAPASFPGIVDRIVVDDDHHAEQSGTLRIVPALALLELRRNTRIFQGQSALAIVQSVLKEGLAPKGRRVDVTALDASRYSTRDYCVQYQETDLAFVHRLLEEEGIGYHFDRQPEAEVLVLFDDSRNQHRVPTMQGEGLVSYEPRSSPLEGAEPITWFTTEGRLTSQSVAVRDHDWTRFRDATLVARDGEGTPEVYLHGEGTGTTLHEQNQILANLLQLAVGAMVPDGLPVGSDGMVRDLLGVTLGSFTTHNLDHIARVRRELHAQEAASAHGEGRVLSFAAGSVFELINHPTLGTDGAYLLTRVAHNTPDIETVGRDADAFIDNYVNRFSCVPRSTLWRPVRGTPKPRIPSVQTAEVVGPVGAEVHTDAYGRIKVRFAWDRAPHDLMGDYTCWLRVAQLWAGANYPGAMFLPRVGMEVLVAFVDGDPDRPLVTGCVHNGRNGTPQLLPLQATKSILKTRTIPGGMGYNELSFEDAMGREELFLRAQRDMRQHALHDHETFVGNNHTVAVRGAHSLFVEGTCVTQVGTDMTHGVDGNEQWTVGRDRLSIVAGALQERVGSGAATTVETGSRLVTVSQGEQVFDVKGRVVITHNEEHFFVMQTETDPKGISMETPKSVLIEAGAAKLEVNTSDDNALVISSPTRIELVVGGSRLEITPDKIVVNRKIHPA